MSRIKRTTKEDDLEEIRKGFEKFDVNGTGIINPSELLEAFDAMNIKEKNPFIYEIIESLSLEKEIRQKGGVELEELVSYVYNKVNDPDSNIGLRQIHEVIKDRDNDTISMSTFYDLARNYGDKLNENEIRFLLEKTQMGGNNLTFDEFYTIMKGAGKDNSDVNMSRGSYRNKNNNEVYTKKNKNSNINENISNQNNNFLNKKFIYKNENEPEQEQEQEQQQEQDKEELDINKNNEVDIEIERRFDSPQKNYVEEYHEEQEIENALIEDNDINNNEIHLESEQNPIQEDYQYNQITEEIKQPEYNNISHEEYSKEYEPNANVYSKDNNEVLSSLKIINPSDINESPNLNELSESHDNPRNSEPQSETSSQFKYSYRKRKIGAAPIHDKSDNNINLNDSGTKVKKEKETKITNLPGGGKQIEVVEKTEIVKEKPYIRGYRNRFVRNKKEDNENVNNKEEKKEEKKSYYRIRKPFQNNNDEVQVSMGKVNVEENNEVNIPKRYHRRYRESKTSTTNNNQ